MPVVSASVRVAWCVCWLVVSIAVAVIGITEKRKMSKQLPARRQANGFALPEFE
ncbi:MAG: hypothetical protein IPJ89_04710 [Candidatus Iainarchaeum archaeon]|uniref:Uncharacterized protein n=1 Tax=Candidatus Iainarchaeum sp. TaxID=3101447 RepID=A0A7T9DJD9_9ARCH|nr:MAG: hypothetical protein IPJ89_04710 [Candidatus Diapherotrites archaeon]